MTRTAPGQSYRRSALLSVERRGCRAKRWRRILLLCFEVLHDAPMMEARWMLCDKIGVFEDLWNSFQRQMRTYLAVSANPQRQPLQSVQAGSKL